MRSTGWSGGKLQQTKERFALAAVMGAAFSVSVAYGVVLPGLPRLLGRVVGAPSSIAAHTGWLTAAYMLAVLVMSPAWGKICDRIGPHFVLRAALAGSIAASISFPLIDRLVPLYLMRLGNGVFAAGVITAAGAYVASHSTQSRNRLTGFASLSAASLLGFLVGPALYAWPASASAIVPFFYSGAIGVVALSALFVMPKRMPVQGVASEGNLPEPIRAELITMFVFIFVVLYALASFETALTLVSELGRGLDLAALGMLFAECAAVMLAVQVLGLPLLARFRPPERVVVVCGALALAVGIVAFGTVRSEREAMLDVALVAVPSGALIPFLTARASAAGANAGIAIGLASSASSGGQALGAIVAGVLYAALGPNAPFVATAALLTAMSLLVVVRAIL